MPLDPNELSAARLTPVGRGAIATVRVCGRLDALVTVDPEKLGRLNSLFRAANGIPLFDQPLFNISFGQWGLTDGEDLVICRISDEVLEIHCHGGDAAVQRVLNDLSIAGCNVVGWHEQVAATADIFEVECLNVLSRTTTWRTTKFALEQTNGLLRTALLRLKDCLDSIEKDFDRQVDALLRWADFGFHLSVPWNVVLTGRPNVGKSSLINALLGYQRAIVFDEPGTTRDVVTGETAFEGWPVSLSDTAGIRDDAGDLEAAGIAVARDRLRAADLIIALIDIGQPPTIDDEKLLEEWPNPLIVAHKSDRVDCWRDRLPEQAIRVSSVTGTGLDELQRQVIERLVPVVPVPGTPILLTQRQVKRLRELRTSKTIEDRFLSFKRLFESFEFD